MAKHVGLQMSICVTQGVNDFFIVNLSSYKVDERCGVSIMLYEECTIFYALFNAVKSLSPCFSLSHTPK